MTIRGSTEQRQAARALREINRRVRLLLTARGRRGVMTITAQLLWSGFVALIVAMLSLLVLACIVLSLLVLESFRKDIGSFIGGTQNSVDPTIQIGWPLITAAAVLALVVPSAAIAWWQRITTLFQ